MLHLERCLLSELDVVAPDTMTAEVYAVACLENRALAIQPQLEMTCEEIIHRLPAIPQICFVIAHDDHIIHVANILPRTQRVLGILVSLVEVEIGEHLARQIADRHANTCFTLTCLDVDAEQSAALLIVNDAPQELQQFLVFENPVQDTKQDGMIDAVKVFADIELQHVDLARRVADVLLQLANRSLRAAANPAGVARRDIPFIEQVIDLPIYSPLHYAIAKRQRHDEPFLRVRDVELAVSADMVRMPDEFILQLNKIFFEIPCKCQHLTTLRLVSTS